MSDLDTNDLLAEVRAQIVEWERTETRSRPEHEAAEAFTRAFAELDAAMKDGQVPPTSWVIARLAHDEVPGGTFTVVRTEDLEAVLQRLATVTHKIGVTGNMRRLWSAVDEAKERT